MDYHTINATIVTPSTEHMAYEQTNHRVDVLEERMTSDTTDIRQRILTVSNDFEEQIDNETTALHHRIDTIIANQSATEGNSELVDIRMGTDGNTYTCAGTAVRSQLFDLNMALGRESWFYPAMEPGRFSPSNGTPIEDNNFRRTAQNIDLTGYQSLDILPAQNSCVVFLDADDQYLSYSYIVAGNTLTVSQSQGAKMKIFIQSVNSHDLRIKAVRQGDYALDSSVRSLENQVSRIDTDFGNLTGCTTTLLPTMEYGRIDLNTLENIEDAHFIRTVGYLTVTDYQSVTVTAAEGYNVGIILYDENHQKIRHQFLTPQSSAALSGKYARLFTTRAENTYAFPDISQPLTNYMQITALTVPMIYTRSETDSLLNHLSHSPLFGKKWVACGDSFTEGDFTGYTDRNGNTHTNSDAYDPEMHCYKTYPWHIAKRNCMTLVNEAKCGTTMALTKEYVDGQQSIGYKTPFSYQRYASIPDDADYITLWFGINDANHTYLGTISDSENTTFYGAWNMVLEYLIEHHPYAKIGIVITESCAAPYRNAVRECALKWGIPYLDMMGDDKVPVIFGRASSLGLCQRARELRTAAFEVSSSNQHPNLKAHEYQSTFIENWLKSL